MDHLQIYRKLIFSLFCVLFYKQEVIAQMNYSDVMLNIGDANYGIFDGEAPYDEEKVLNYQSEPDFIQQYIFPGGMLPSKPQLQEITKQVGLELKEYKSFKISYAKTLNLWNKQFQLSWNELSKMGFSLRFKRMWEYYFSYCETGFLTGSTDVSHYVLQK